MSGQRLAAVAILAVVGCLGAARHAMAQSGNSTIKGIIVASDPRRPLEGARILLLGTGHSATTDARGTFEFSRLEAGQYVIQASAIGFTALSSPLLLKEKETLEVEFVAQSEAAELPDLVVTKIANNGPADWLRRKAEGNGRYITRDQLERRQVARVPDALRLVPGVRVECRGTVCVARMARAPRGCSPGYFLDGIPSDPAVLWLTPVSDVEGIEVYSGPAETPAELEGARSRCGAIALWTRPPPPRRPKEKKPKPDSAAAVQRAESVPIFDSIPRTND